MQNRSEILGCSVRLRCRVSSRMFVSDRAKDEEDCKAVIRDKIRCCDDGVCARDLLQGEERVDGKATHEWAARWKKNMETYINLPITRSLYGICGRMFRETSK